MNKNQQIKIKTYKNEKRAHKKRPFFFYYDIKVFEKTTSKIKN
jgi:hypothetical protein|uniref:Uncharacterized protein n=1 Tax=viral metagenome TaxID=1070528 RepID=A0A6C0BW02_9ZZZZ